jgi:hypothetical protein
MTCYTYMHMYTCKYNAYNVVHIFAVLKFFNQFYLRLHIYCQNMYVDAFA